MSRAVPHTPGRKWHTSLMGIFTKQVTKAAISEPAKVQAAVGFGGTYNKNAIGAFYQYS